MRTRVVVIVVAALSLGLALAAPADATRSDGAPIHSTATVLPDVKAFGDAPFIGWTSSATFNQPIIGVEGTKSAPGYWEVASDGGVFSFSDAKFHGSMGGSFDDTIAISGMAARPVGDGYWMADADGRVFPFGSAPALRERRRGPAGAVDEGPFPPIPRPWYCTCVAYGIGAVPRMGQERAKVGNG